MHYLTKTFILGFTFVTLISCKNTAEDPLASITVLNDSIKMAYAPDKRVAIYDIHFTLEQQKLHISGETDQPEALNAMLEIIDSIGFQVIDKTNLLPDQSVDSFNYAMVNNSVANIRSKPKHSGELATQAVLGTPLKLLKIQGDFYLIQSPDGYISWVDHGGVSLFTKERYNQWAKAPKVIFTHSSGYVYQHPQDEFNKLSDIVLGAELVLIGETKDYFKVQFPDQREGYLRKSESAEYKKWISEVEASGNLIELYARQLLGAPYLWGGTSTKGMDCSGFTKTVYLMNGYIIPRDASQQIMAGEIIDPELKFEALKKGDLMFFGKKATDSTKQRVTHVGIWLDNDRGEFIHASGRVKIGSILQDSPNFDAFNKNRYLGSRRYLDHQDKFLLNLKNINQNRDIKS